MSTYQYKYIKWTACILVQIISDSIYSQYKSLPYYRVTEKRVNH